MAGNNIISNFRFGRKKSPEELFYKSITSGDTLHMDEQGRHLIFRTIDGKVRPIRVSAEEFAEWLVNNNVNIDPADQKTLRELDKELEIMERAAEYGGPKLQKQYEDYFNQRREQYQQLAGGYYQAALQNQAEAFNKTPEQIHQEKQELYEATVDEGVVRREDLERRGWDSALQTWVSGQDAKNGLDQTQDAWYYNRVFGILVSNLIEEARSGKPLSEINIDDVFSNEFIQDAMSKYYGDFFGGEQGDPKKIAAAVKTVQKYYENDTRGNRKSMTNFIDYWYSRMAEDFEKGKELEMGSAPSTSFEDIPESAVPESLPEVFTSAEERSLLGMYSKASGSKLNAAHRVMVHSLGRLIESIPVNERVSAAVDLSDGSKGIHAVHKEAYKRTFKDQNTLGVIPNRDDLVRDALAIASRSAKGSTSDKISAIKRIAMIMGTIDGAATLNSNPGIQEAQFTRKWHDTATNAGRVKSEGPGLIDLITDDQKRQANIYTNQDLKIMHSPKQSESEEEEKPAKKKVEKDIGDGYKFSGNKLYSPDGFVAHFEYTSSGYATVKVHSPDGEELFDTKIYSPPIKLSDMDEADRKSYLDSVKSQIGSMIDQFKKFSGRTFGAPGGEESESPTFVGVGEEGAFRVPIFDFGGENLTQDDREFLGNVIEIVDEANLSVSQVSPGIYRIVNPVNGKSFDLVFNSKKKRIVGASRGEDGSITPFPNVGVEDLSSQLELKTAE